MEKYRQSELLINTVKNYNEIIHATYKKLHADIMYIFFFLISKKKFY